MPEAYVIDAVRTAVGKRGGALAGIHPVDLGAIGWRGLLDRADVDPAAVEDVIAGCVDAIGGQAGNIARLSWLAAGYPEEVPGVTVDRQCGSSQQAISFGAQAIMSGTADLIVAGGMQSMSQIPISSAMTVGEQFGFTSPTDIADEIGIWLMFCIPPATMRSAVPDMIACAPKEIACWLEPHCRSTVTPGTSSG